MNKKVYRLITIVIVFINLKLTSIRTRTLLFSSDANKFASQPFYSVYQETKQSTNCEFNE